MSRKKKTIKERLLSKIVVNDCTGCWNWNGFKSGGKYGGYAMIKVDGKNMLATRVSYSEFNGAIPDGLFVLHKCDDPSCINPSHLFAGTQSENMIDMHKKSRLWERCIDSPYSTSQAEQMLLEWLKSHAVSKRTILIGNNINFDKSWLKEFMPEVYKYVHYRSIDVSGVNELVRVFKPELDAQVKSHKRYGHTALADCYESLAELQLYIREVFKG